MEYRAPKWMTQWLGLLALMLPGLAQAGFAKPLQDVPEHLGTGAFAIDHYWSLAGLIGFVVVVALLAGFYRRDK
jgi:hypothetical protein